MEGRNSAQALETIGEELNWSLHKTSKGNKN